tara:strand:- start:330 stop:1049 length:720 start_codon:yes stop_codon:yes gene_type:complete
MLIDDFTLPGQRVRSCKYYGLDSPTKISPKNPAGRFEEYPVQDFDYQFNSWGFRGPEYDQFIGTPVNICVGDSFTVNLGGPIEHSWSSQLQEYFNKPTLNLGMDGAGNDAIRIVYDRAIKMFDVQHAFVMYSYFHRRLVDNEFTHYNGKIKTGMKPAPLNTDEENFSYFEDQYIDDAYGAFIPKWCYTETELQYIQFFESFDYPDGGRSEWANRDYHHMNQDLNKLIAEYYYELSRTDS